MTRDEIVAALRCMAVSGESVMCCEGCPFCTEAIDGWCLRKDEDVCASAADLIENQQRHIEALMLANGSLKDAIARRDAQIEKMSEDLQIEKNTADQHAAINDTLYDSNAKLAADRKALINELCQYCGKYKQAHEGACDGCKWRDM